MTEILYGLALLACPVGMGVMMLMMMRGGKQDTQAPAGKEADIAQLRAEVEQLRAAQRAAEQSPPAATPISAHIPSQH